MWIVTNETTVRRVVSCGPYNDASKKIVHAIWLCNVDRAQAAAELFRSETKNKI